MLALCTGAGLAFAAFRKDELSKRVAPHVAGGLPALLGILRQALPHEPLDAIVDRVARGLLGLGVERGPHHEAPRAGEGGAAGLVAANPAAAASRSSFSSSALSITTALEINASFALDPMVLISRWISWIRKSIAASPLAWKST